LDEPTAQTLDPETATPFSSPQTTGTLTCRLHALPFQCMISGLSWQWQLGGEIRNPTAHASSAETAVTAVSAPCTGFGLVTCDHFAPFQCSSSVFPAGPDPTAQALLAEVAETPSKYP
jgi:hypothetical protein